ncbi:hypothetical protein GCM10027566_06880 [Arachidicoccus ginsenosidivorans]
MNMTDNKDEYLAIYKEIEQAELFQPEDFNQIEPIKVFVKQHGLSQPAYKAA